MMTKAQTVLAMRLGWIAELQVETGMQDPSIYYIDVAHRELKIAIEVDGVGHSFSRQKLVDARKTAFLESRGWRVLRFKNKEIFGDLDRVIDQVNQAIFEKLEEKGS